MSRDDSARLKLNQRFSSWFRASNEVWGAAQFWDKMTELMSYLTGICPSEGMALA
jgi:hypothetical protein